MEKLSPDEVKMLRSEWTRAELLEEATRLRAKLEQAKAELLAQIEHVQWFDKRCDWYDDQLTQAEAALAAATKDAERLDWLENNVYVGFELEPEQGQEDHTNWRTAIDAAKGEK